MKSSVCLERRVGTFRARSCVGTSKGGFRTVGEAWLWIRSMDGETPVVSVPGESVAVLTGQSDSALGTQQGGAAEGTAACPDKAVVKRLCRSEAARLRQRATGFGGVVVRSTKCAVCSHERDEEQRGSVCPCCEKASRAAGVRSVQVLLSMPEVFERVKRGSELLRGARAAATLLRRG